jgi:formamidopyrimidine-DNA glycosylase
MTIATFTKQDTTITRKKQPPPGIESIGLRLDAAFRATIDSMPELPDLVHIVKALGPEIEGRRIVGAKVKNSIVLRVLVPGSFPELVAGRTMHGLERHGPFLRLRLESREVDASAPGGGELELVMHLMLAGRLKLAAPGDKALPATAFSLVLEDGRVLHYGDEKSMGKVYLCPAGSFDSIPGYSTQGVDLVSPDFTFEVFSALIEKKRCQARVFVMDQSCLSAVGNAYADEILFEAGIHPKAPCYALPPEKKRALFEAVVSVLAWGIDEVEKAGAPLEDKVRGHMRVRGRAGEKCPRCGATIRKAGVLGFDSFFCPVCQPDLSGRGLDWTKLENGNG